MKKMAISPECFVCFWWDLQTSKEQSFNLTIGTKGITQLLKSNFERSKCRWRHQCHAFAKKGTIFWTCPPNILIKTDHTITETLLYGDPSFSAELNTNRFDSSTDCILNKKKFESCDLLRNLIPLIVFQAIDFFSFVLFLSYFNYLAFYSCKSFIIPGYRHFYASYICFYIYKIIKNI